MAKTTDWGLTDAGFRRPTYAELLDALEYKARELFGSKANLTVRSPLGIFLRIYAWMLNLLFSTLEDVYNSRFVDTAVGHSLYNLGRAIGLRLLGAQKAVGYLTFTGEIGTEVPEGYLAETIAGQQYITLQSGVILDGSITLPASAVVAGPDGNTDAGTITISPTRRQVSRRLQTPRRSRAGATPKRTTSSAPGITSPRTSPAASTSTPLSPRSMRMSRPSSL